MQDIYYQETVQILSTRREIYYGNTHALKISPLSVFEDKPEYKRLPTFYKNKVLFVNSFCRRTYFCDKAVPCRSKNIHNVLQPNSDEDNYHFLPLSYSYATIKPHQIHTIHHKTIRT